MKLFHFLKDHIPAVVICALLLTVQANLELSLPNYMSDIVDVGLQQQGISSPVPETIRQSTLDDLFQHMSLVEAEKVNATYSEPNADGIRTYTGTRAQAEEGAVVGAPMEAAEAALMSAQEAREQGEQGTEPEGNASSTSEALAYQRAIAFVTQEYEAQGIDLNDVQQAYLMRIAAIMFALCAGTLITTICVGLVAARTAATIARDTRRKLFNRVMRFSPAEITKFSQASLITRTTNDLQQIQQVTVMFLRMMMLAPIMGIVAFIQVTATRSGMEWIIGVALIAIFAVLGILLGTTMPKFKAMQSLIDRLNLVSRDMLDGLMPIRAFGREGYELDRFDTASTNLMKTQLFVNRAMSFMMPMIMLIMNLLTMLIVWVGAQGVAVGDLQVGTMMAFITYAMQIVMSFMILGMIAVIFPRAQVSSERVMEVIDCPLSITDPADPIAPKADAPRGEVEFRNVTFAYPDAERPVIHDVSFTTKAGQTLGIIGSTGSGKTTLIKLIPRLYDASDGTVLVDGVDVRKMTISDLRSRIGYVPQQSFLFSGTIESNIKFADEAMPDAQMERAASIAQATEFIESNPEGFDAPISQGGTNVSGGQRQRLSIARALADDPEIIVFDDSFSALDYATDARLREALRTQVTDASIIIVAQRVATIMQSDQILVLESGEVVGRGTHDELLRTCKTYREIALSQLSPEELGLSEAEVMQTLSTEDAEGGERS